MHRDFFLRHAALGTMAVAALLPVPAPAADAIVIDAGKIKWGDVPPSLPRGAQMAVLQGDPSKPEPFVLRLKAPANYRIAPHWHSNDENLTVLSGAFHLGMGERADRATAQVLRPGAFHFLPARTNHYAFTTAPTVLQVHGQGPFDITYLDAKDNPDKSAPKP